MSKLSFDPSKSKDVAKALEDMKIETLKSLGKEFKGAASITGGNLGKFSKSTFSKTTTTYPYEEEYPTDSLD